MTDADHPPLEFIAPSWRPGARVEAFTTTRAGGASQRPYDGLNLGEHVGDNPESVATNRQRLHQIGKLPTPPVWLEQTHSTRVAEVDTDSHRLTIRADATVTRVTDCVLAVLTADCLPVLLCSPEYRVVAAVHAGWRGLANDIVQNTIEAMDCPAPSIHAWLGPAIGPSHFEVGDDVWDAFVASDWQMARCFHATAEQKFMADLYAIARRQLSTLGVTQVSGGDYCTYADADRFYSYRRDGATGRLATLVWMTD